MVAQIDGLARYLEWNGACGLLLPMGQRQAVRVGYDQSFQGEWVRSCEDVRVPPLLCSR